MPKASRLLMYLNIRDNVRSIMENTEGLAGLLEPSYAAPGRPSGERMRRGSCATFANRHDGSKKNVYVEYA
jgi:hypothetical protein